MSLALNKPKLDNLADEIWKSAERLRGKFKAYEYQNVVLPIIVIRRLECVLIKWREEKSAEVLAKRPKLPEKELAKLVKGLETSTAPFSNKTAWTLRKVYEEDHTLLEENFRAYINGFSKNVDDIIEHFNYRATIGQMVKNNRLAPILNQYKELELGPDKLSPLEMGYIYEELLRRFSEQSGEEAGEHFTPREVIRLMVELLDIPIPDRHLSIYDPASGTGGMLSVAKEHLLDRAATPEQKAKVEKFVTVHGQELSPTNYAICQADLLIKNDQQAKVHLGNSLIPHDPHSKEPGDQLPESKFRFDVMLSNPPFGVTWGGKDGYEAEALKLEKTRYRAGMPRVNDGALLFLQTMLAKMKEPEKGASRIAIIFNGSPLSNGDCGSGESEIRRWILENDWLDAIVMLPDQLFYNTGIFTYIWLLRNDKPASHQGRVMLIDARQQFEKEPKSFGNKRNRITDAHRAWIEDRYRDGWKKGYADEQVKIFRREDFAYHKVSVVFWQFDEHDKPTTVTEPYGKTFTAANLKKESEFYDSDLTFRVRLKVGKTEKTETFTLSPEDNATKKLKALMEDEPEIVSVEWTHRHYVKDDEYIPHGEDIEAFLKREIAKPIIRWEDSPQLGYEILPNNAAEFDGKCTGEILAFKPERIASRFLFYCVGSRWFIERCNALAYGAKMPRVSWPTQLAQFNVPLPPLPEQERIAAYLDASCVAIDSAVTAKCRQLETLDALRKSIIVQAVTKGLNRSATRRDAGVEWFGEIPKHWRCEHLKRFTTRIQTGCTPPTDTLDYYVDGNIPWFAPSSYDGNIELREPRKLINELALREGALRMFPADTVFLVGIGATIGKVGLIREEASCNQQIIGIVTNHQMLGRYLAYQFKIYEQVIPGIASATTLPIFDQVKTGYLPTLQPPREEQEAICAFLDAKLAEVKRLVASIEIQIKTLAAYRKSLIHECVTGQRRISEADLTRVKAHG